MAILRRLKIFFTSDFESDTFAYVLYPFLRIFKIFGFAPFVLTNGDILRGKKVEFSVICWVLSILDIVLYFVGFTIGVHHLSEEDNWLRLRDETIIAYYTSWVQIVSIFLMGCVAVISAWTHLKDILYLCKAIFKIDYQLNKIEGITIDYEHLRKRLFIEFLIGFMAPVSLSMINCIIIQPTANQFVFTTTCFWFICFAPIMLLTFKEFQFYNILYILKLKFELVNEKLRGFGLRKKCHAKKQRKRYTRVGTVDSVSQIPLTTMVSTESNVDISNATSNNNISLEQSTLEEIPNVVTLQKLLKIYSQIADAVELHLKIFSWHLVFLTATSIGVIIIQCYNLFALLVDSLHMQTYQIVFVVAWILVQIAVIGINVTICGKTSRTMSQTGVLLHKIRPPTTGSDNDCVFYQILQIFSLEVLQRSQIFTAAGFFDMNYKLITSIIASVTTYLVIIIQFHLNNVPVVRTEAKKLT